jgi:hypothetical protein
MPDDPSHQPKGQEGAEPPAAGAPGPIEHLVAREEAAGVVIVGLDADCRAVYTTTLKRRPAS